MTIATLELLEELFHNWNALVDASQVRIRATLRRVSRGKLPEHIQRRFDRLIENAKDRGIPVDWPDD